MYSYVIVKDPGPVLSVKIICSSPKDENILFLLKKHGPWSLTILKHSHFVLFMEGGPNYQNLSSPSMNRTKCESALKRHFHFYFSMSWITQVSSNSIPWTIILFIVGFVTVLRYELGNKNWKTRPPPPPKTWDFDISFVYCGDYAVHL